MTDDDAKKKEEEAALAAAAGAAAAQPQVKEMLQCLYKDPRSGKPCPFESRSEVVLQMHERAEHIKKTGSRPTRMRSPSRTPRSPKGWRQKSPGSLKVKPPVSTEEKRSNLNRTDSGAV